MVLAFDSQAKRVILRHGTLFLRFLRLFAADDFAERDRFAEHVDHHIQIGIQRLVIETDQPFVELDRADINHPFGGFGIRVGLGQIEHPVGTAISQTLKLGLRAGQIDARDDHLLNQQRQQRQSKFDMLEVDHLWRFRPVRIAQRQVIRNEVRRRHPGAPAAQLRLASPAHIQIAIDCERTVQRFADFLVEGGLDAIPVESDYHNDQYSEHQQKCGARPGENLAAARHA